jgi:hypothetical protein
MKIDLSGNRRTFLKQAALFGSLGILLLTGRRAVAKPKSPLPEPATSGQGYRLTDHVKKYYETARA